MLIALAVRSLWDGGKMSKKSSTSLLASSGKFHEQRTHKNALRYQTTAVLQEIDYISTKIASLDNSLEDNLSP